jgi:hypothetical protein
MDPQISQIAQIIFLQVCVTLALAGTQVPGSMD